MYERISLIVGRALTFRPRDLAREEGQGVTEYGLALAFVAVALLGVMAVLSGAISQFINTVGNDIQQLPGSF